MSVIPPALVEGLRRLMMSVWTCNADPLNFIAAAGREDGVSKSSASAFIPLALQVGTEEADFRAKTLLVSY